MAVCLAVAALAACSNPPRRNNLGHVPDWEQEPARPVAAASGPVAPPMNSSPPATADLPPAGHSFAPVPPETWVPLQKWCRLSRLPELTRLSGGPEPLFELRAPGGVLQLHPGSQVVHWDGVELHLGFAPQFHNGQLYVQSLDLSKTLEPLLEEAPPLLPSPRPVLVLDPGHGGENAGTKSVLGEHYEKEFTLDWARRLQALMTADGWHVFLTRPADYDLALSNRVNFAEQHRADLFLSLHFNSAAPSQTEAGLETYCLTPTGLPSNITRGFDDDSRLVFPNNAFDAQNLQLALQLHRALLEVNGHHDRGVRRARFPGVLRNQERPAILIEGGYLSNPREARLIADPAYRQQLAQALADALKRVNTGPNIAANSLAPAATPTPSEVLPPDTTVPAHPSTGSETTVQSHTAEDP